MKLKATLRLENGMEFHGWSFGSAQAVSGEVVFNTSMVGYPEQLTDATYSGQILCLTYPLIGNYGVPSEELLAENLSKNFESDKIHPKGLIAFEVCELSLHSRCHCFHGGFGGLSRLGCGLGLRLRLWLLCCLLLFGWLGGGVLFVA